MVVLICSLFALTAPQTVQSTVFDRIVVTVNGDIITQSDLRAATMLKLVTASDEAGVAAALVDRRLVLAELRRFQVATPDAATLARRRAEWEAGLGVADINSVLASAGVQSWFVDRWLADDLRRDRYLTQRFATLSPERKDEAVRQWMDGLRARADVVYRNQRF